MSLNPYQTPAGLPTAEAPKPLRSIVFRHELRKLLFEVMEHGRIIHWIAAGVYYGYPQHCIEAFLARATVRVTRQGTPEELIYVETDLPEAQPYESVGCIPSEELLCLPLEEAVALINQHRFATHPFVPYAENEPECADLEALIESNPAFAKRFVDMANNILNKEDAPHEQV
jgi:hypothetical protein